MEVIQNLLLQQMLRFTNRTSAIFFFISHLLSYVHLLLPPSFYFMILEPLRSKMACQMQGDKCLWPKFSENLPLFPALSFLRPPRGRILAHLVFCLIWLMWKIFAAGNTEVTNRHRLVSFAWTSEI